MTERCKSCDHDTQTHAEAGSGCLFKVTSVPSYRSQICPCDFNAYKPPPCDECEGTTGIRCDLPAGHQEQHEGTHTPRLDGTESVGYELFVRWPRNQWDRKQQ
jgi:hypothetical protein